MDSQLNHFRSFNKTGLHKTLTVAKDNGVGSNGFTGHQGTGTSSHLHVGVQVGNAFLRLQTKYMYSSNEITITILETKYKSNTSCVFVDKVSIEFRLSILFSL